MEMETDLLKVPIESMRINLKAMQSSIEKDLTGLAANQADSAVDKAQLIKELKRLRSKASELADVQRALSSRMSKRQEYFEEMRTVYANRKTNEEAFRTAVDRSMDVAIVNRCIERGQAAAAQLYAQERHVEELIDFELLVEASVVVGDLRAHNLDSALRWCVANRGHLRKKASSLEPELRTQEILGLFYENKVYEAVAYSRKHMTRYAAFYPNEVSHIAGVLGGASSQQDNFSTSDVWERLRNHFLHEFMEYHGRSSLYTLLTRVCAGLAALHTRSCGAYDPKNINPLQADKLARCPACSDTLRPLAEMVPFAHHVHSILPPDPVMLPNNRVYSFEDLETHARKMRSWPDILDPLSNEVYSVDKLTKVYPS